MDKQEITDKLTGFLKRALANKDAEIKPDVDFKDLGLNSSGRLALTGDGARADGVLLNKPAAQGRAGAPERGISLQSGHLPVGRAVGCK